MITALLKYRYEYVVKLQIEELEGIEAFLGCRVHEAMRKLYQDMKFTKIPTLEEVLAYYNEQWKKNWHKDIHIVRKEYTEENYRRMGEKFITMYYKKHHPFDKGIIMGLEEIVIISLNPEGTYKLRGYMDRLMKVKDGVYEIHDYKTSSHPPTQEQLEQDRQLALYSIGVKQMFPNVKKIELIWHYMTFDQEVRSSRTEEQISRLKEEINRIIQEIELAEQTNNFPAKESKLCNWCSYGPLCPMFKHLCKTEEMPANKYLKEPGVKLVNKYLELTEKKKEFNEEIEQEIEKVEEALFKYAKKNNLEMVAGSNVKARVKTYENIKFPSKRSQERLELENILKKAGKWDDVSTLDSSLLSKAMDEKIWHQSLLKKIERFRRIEEIRRIFLSKLEGASN
jgi:putative RecB family exonuclease